MRDSWEYELAKELKSRNNKVPIGPCIGFIEALKPEPIITIQNGTYRLNNDQIYVCNQILERFSPFKYLMSKPRATFLKEGTLVTSKYAGDYLMSSSDLSVDGGMVHLEEVWQPGDYVLVVPSEDEQSFFIVDILRRLSRDASNGY